MDKDKTFEEFEKQLYNLCAGGLLILKLLLS